MRTTCSLLAAVTLLLLAAPSADAQSEVPYNQRVRFAAPPSPLDSSTIELRVIDVRTDASVAARICFRSGAEVVTDTSGAARISHLRGTNTPVRVLASGYEMTSLTFYPGKLGRSFATVRLVPSDTASANPACPAPGWTP